MFPMRRSMGVTVCNGTCRPNGVGRKCWMWVGVDDDVCQTTVAVYLTLIWVKQRPKYAPHH